MRYPNLELLEYQTEMIIRNDKELLSKIKEIQKEKKYITKARFTADVFVQTWGSTCTAFDIMPDGSPAVGGSAMTDAYTTVFHEELLDMYFVFVDNRPCYTVSNATDKFYEDLKNHSLESLSKARTMY